MQKRIFISNRLNKFYYLLLPLITFFVKKCFIVHMLGAIFVPLSPLFSYKTMVIYNVVPLKFSRTRTISYIVTVTRDVELIEILKLAS